MRSRFLKLNRLVISMGICFGVSHAFAIADGVLCSTDDPCRAKGIYTKRSPGPTKSDSVRLNPAEVPFDSVTGIESIYYGGSFDFALVKGLGRVGAAISPSNNQETFFGAPAVETSQDFFYRADARQKYVAPKYTLAGGVSLISKDGEGLRHLDISIGALAKYNKVTGHVKAGGGILAIAGPIWLGASKYQDEDVIETQSPNLVFPIDVTVLSGGLATSSVSVDYSILKVDSSLVPSTATVITVTGFIKRAIFTVARRDVDSGKPRFDFNQDILVYDQKKTDYFGGAQYRLAPFLVVGVFYNYYLLHEGSIGATVFF